MRRVGVTLDSAGARCGKLRTRLIGDKHGKTGSLGSTDKHHYHRERLWRSDNEVGTSYDQ
jgi:hypothetical protein